MTFDELLMAFCRKLAHDLYNKSFDDLSLEEKRTVRGQSYDLAYDMFYYWS